MFNQTVPPITPLIRNRVQQGPSTVKVKKRSDLVRFLEQVAMEKRGCWIWQGYRRETGYGLFRMKDRTFYAHRAAHEFFIGPIPEGNEIDHLCRNSSCVNPDHLGAVSPTLNVRRGTGGVWRSCERLHPSEPTRVGERGRGGFYCRECQRVRERQRRAEFAARTAKKDPQPVR